MLKVHMHQGRLSYLIFDSPSIESIAWPGVLLSMAKSGWRGGSGGW